MDCLLGQQGAYREEWGGSVRHKAGDGLGGGGEGG